MTVPNVAQMFPSKFISGDDLAASGPKTLTIQRIYQDEAVNNEGKKSTVWTIQFAEARKPMILNKSNAKTIAKIYGSTEANDWIGKRITIMHRVGMAYGDIKNLVTVKPELPPPVVSRPAVPAAPVVEEETPSTPDDHAPAPPVEAEVSTI